MALTQVKTSAIADDAVTTDKLANAINTERTANTAKVSLTDNSVTLAKMAGGTDGQIITYDASGDPVAVGPGTDGQVLTSTGAGSPPAFEDIPAAGAALTGSTNNTITTVTGANAIQGEANFTFDGTKVGITGNLNVGGQLTNTAHSLAATKSNGNCIVIGNSSGSSAGSHDAQIVASDGTNFNNLKIGGHETKVFANVSGGTGYAETWRFDSSGNLACKIAGKGIDFAVTSGPTSSGSSTPELFSDYEEGKYSPTITRSSSNVTYSKNKGRYIRTGNLCFVWFDIETNGNNSSGSGTWFLSLPFSFITNDDGNDNAGHGACSFRDMDFMSRDQGYKTSSYIGADKIYLRSIDSNNNEVNMVESGSNGRITGQAWGYLSQA